MSSGVITTKDGMATTHAEVINHDILAFIKNGIRHG